MARNNYVFSDVSHHKGDLNHQVFADAGHRLLIAKASDNYHLPNKDGQYNIPAEWHTDARFVDNYMGARRVGLAAGAYHFARFDRPLGATLPAIVDWNLRYYADAINLLPQEERDNFVCGILDMEQSSSQLYAAGFSPKGAAINEMALAMVEIFAEEFPFLVFYAGSWWTDTWLTPQTTMAIAELATCWEPEYPSFSLSTNKQELGSLRANYVPSVPAGFQAEFATSTADCVGKIFAWQFSDKGRFPGIDSNIDLNVTEFPKEELYKLFGTDGAVDPPGPPPVEPPIDLGGIEEQLDRIEAEVVHVRENLASHHLDIVAILEGGTDEPSTPVGKWITVDRDGANVYLSWARDANNTPAPVYTFYPSDGAPVPERIFVASGTMIPVVGSPIKGDSGKEAYIIDTTRSFMLAPGSSGIPSATVIASQQTSKLKKEVPALRGALVVETRFIKR